jgi:hypothetical protein
VTEKNEVHTVELAQATMLGDLMQIVVDEVKAAPDVWQKLSEHKQDALIHRVEQRVREAVRQCVELIAANGRVAIPGAIESVQVKDALKAVVIVAKSDPHRHELIDATKKAVMIVIADPTDYHGGAGDVQADKDQPELPLAASKGNPRPVPLEANGDGEFTEEMLAAWWTALGYQITEQTLFELNDEEFNAQADYAKGESDEFPAFMSQFRVDDLGGGSDEGED